MENWQFIDKVFSEEEAELIKKRMEKSGFDLKVESRKSFGEMPCWDVYAKTNNPSERISV